MVSPSVYIIMAFLLSIFSKSKKENGMASASKITTTAYISLEDRLRGALWGFLAGDALAAPTHWYYGGKNQIIRDYGGPIEDYTKPNYRLGGSILNKSDLNGGGRSSGNSGKKELTIIGDVINHGKKDLWSPNESIHYHATLQRGENTLEAQLARVLMKSIVHTQGHFDPNHFRKSYIEFMTTPNSHNDTYASTCHRMFFANLVHKKLPPEQCPDNDQHNVDTVDGIVLPTIVAMASSCKNPTQSGQAAAECASVTRRSQILEKVSSSWAEVVASSLHDTEENFQKKFQEFSWSATGRAPKANASGASTMSACYLSQSLPGFLDLTAKYLRQPVKVWEGLLENANVGGENVHRGSVMGAILGARAGNSNLPGKLRDGLYHRSELEKEIDEFVQAVLSKDTTKTAEKKSEL